MKISCLLHGKNPTPTDLLLIYGGGAIALALILASALIRGWDVSMIQLLVLGVLGYDVVAGAIANATPSVNAFYAEQKKPIRYGFLLVHILYPVALFLAFGMGIGIYGFAAYAIAMVSGCAVIAIEGPYQRPLAIALLAFGLISLLIWLNPPEALAWFGPCLLVKLGYSFPLNHQETRSGGQ